MGDETRDHGRNMSPGAGDISPFIWPLGKSVVPDEMNTSFGPRIDADRWDFHDGIDLPAPVGTPVHAMADGVVHRAGPADKTGTGQGFGSTHVLLQVRDPTDGQNDLFLVYLHLNSLEEGVIAGAPVQQGDVMGAVGQEDATYPHLHLEFRKGAPKEDNSVHPLRYLQYSNTPNFTQLRLDRCNFSRVGDDDRRTIRLRFEAPDRREGDLQGVDVELSDEGVEPLKFHVDFDDRDTIKSDKGDEQAFNEWNRRGRLPEIKSQGRRLARAAVRGHRREHLSDIQIREAQGRRCRERNNGKPEARSTCARRRREPCQQSCGL